MGLDNINIWKNLGTVLVIAGVLLIAYAGYMFRNNKLYAYIQLKRGKQEKTTGARPEKPKKGGAGQEIKNKEENPPAKKEREEKNPPAEDAVNAEDEKYGSSTTAPLNEPAEEGTVLLENSIQAAAMQTDGSAVWMGPSEEFYIRKSIIFIHTKEMISDKGEVL